MYMPIHVFVIYMFKYYNTCTYIITLYMQSYDIMCAETRCTRHIITRYYICIHGYHFHAAYACTCKRPILDHEVHEEVYLHNTYISMNLNQANMRVYTCM